VTIGTNIVGVYLSYAIMRKATRDSLWKIEIYNSRYTEVMRELFEYNEIQWLPLTDKLTVVYSYSQADSLKVKELLTVYEKEIKVNVTAITKSL